MQPPYQPSGNRPAPGGDPAYADPRAATTLPPQTQQTIGDLLSAKGDQLGLVRRRLAERRSTAQDVQARPRTSSTTTSRSTISPLRARAPRRAREHLRDGGLDGSEFIKAIDSGTLPQVAFYKPQGNLNEHPGYADILTGERTSPTSSRTCEKSPQWPHMLVIVTYDENGGFWDHVAPPKGDRWGPGTRIPTIIVSPFAKKGIVDHTHYDTTSILRFITRRFELPMLPGLRPATRRWPPTAANPSAI